MQAWFGRFVRSRTFSALFCLLGVGLTFYLTSRLGRLAEGFFGLDIRPAVLLLLSALCLYMLVYVNTPSAEKKTRRLFNLCGIIFSFLPSVIACLLLFDAVRAIFGLQDARLYLIPLALGVAVSGYGFAHAQKVYTKAYTLAVQGGKRKLTAALISDIHAGSYVNRKQLHKIVDAVNGLEPDLVLMAGDTFDQDAFGHCDMEGVREELLRLRPKGQVYAVLGNHDPKSTDPEVRAYFASAGIRLLVDACAETEDFVLAGRDDILGNPERRSLQDLLSGVDTKKPVLVIDHNPLGIDEGIQAGAALVVCGHTHKGQFFPATYFTRWAYGDRGFYGHTQTGSTHSVVSSGAGYFQLPVRIGTNSEVVALHIRRS